MATFIFKVTLTLYYKVTLILYFKVTCPLAERLVEDEERTLLHPTRQAFHGSDLERYKLEKKRERNRIAATKCRLRKMERISQLDGQVRYHYIRRIVQWITQLNCQLSTYKYKSKSRAVS